jgi:hypothetical protein
MTAMVSVPWPPIRIFSDHILASPQVRLGNPCKLVMWGTRPRTWPIGVLKILIAISAARRALRSRQSPCGGPWCRTTSVNWLIVTTRFAGIQRIRLRERRKLPTYRSARWRSRSEYAILRDWRISHWPSGRLNIGIGPCRSSAHTKTRRGSP